MKDYIKGMRTGVPVIFGFIPVAIAYAVMARQAGIGAVETVLMSAAVFAGASQMMAVEMLSQGAAAVTIIVAAFILNLRHLIMSTCVINRIKKEKLWIKLLAVFGVTDESFAIFTTQKKENSNAAFFLGLITVTYSSWVGGTVIGVIASGLLPEIVSASLGVALYAMFIAILVPGIRDNLRLIMLVIFTALLNMGLCSFMDSSWALIAATLIGAFAGTFFVNMEEMAEMEETCLEASKDAVSTLEKVKTGDRSNG